MEECIICLETLNNSNNIVTLSCNHKYHYKCVHDWSVKKNSNTNYPLCPLCGKQKEIINIENFKIKKKNRFKCCNII